MKVRSRTTPLTINQGSGGKPCLISDTSLDNGPKKSYTPTANRINQSRIGHVSPDVDIDRGRPRIEGAVMSGSTAPAQPKAAASALGPDEITDSTEIDWGDIFKTLAIVAGAIGGGTAAAILVEHFTDDTDSRAYAADGTRLSSEIIAAYTGLKSFFSSDETVEGSRRISTPQQIQKNGEMILESWRILTPAEIRVFEAMPYVWADVQDYWAELNDEERQVIRTNWSPLDGE